MKSLIVDVRHKRGSENEHIWMLLGQFNDDRSDQRHPIKCPIRIPTRELSVNVKKTKANYLIPRHHPLQSTWYQLTLEDKQSVGSRTLQLQIAILKINRKWLHRKHLACKVLGRKWRKRKKVKASIKRDKGHRLNRKIRNQRKRRNINMRVNINHKSRSNKLRKEQRL